MPERGKSHGILSQLQGADHEMKRIIGIGFVDALAAIQVEVISDTLNVKRILFLKNVPSEIKRPFDVPGVKIDIVDLASNGFAKEEGDQFFFSVVNPQVKAKLLRKFAAEYGIKKTDYTTIVHPSCNISKTCTFQEGVLAEQGAIITSYTEVGFGVHIKRGVNIGHHCHIGDYCTINPGAVVSGAVGLGEGCMLGTGAVLIDGITIGKGVLIGAGSVVTKDIPPGVIAYGNPCRVVRENDKWSPDSI
jgi:sugar O-acyltransferase (sialic acid O-acetyltransferase NeuD family)